MTGELQISPELVAEIRTELDRGRTRLESTAESSPGSVDAGELTAMLLGMLSTLTDNAAAVSEALAAMSAQVGESGTTFWETDTEVATGFGMGR